MAMLSPLPVRDGVGATRLHVPMSGDWPTVGAYMIERFFHLDPEGLLSRFDRGEIVARDGRPLTRETPLGVEEFIWYYRDPPVETRLPVEIEVIHQDDDLVVIDKPHFLPVAPSGRYLQETALVRLKRELGIQDLVALHRLDRETAGVLLFSRRPPSRNAYHALWRQHQVHKVYEAVAPWHAGLPLPATVSHRLAEPGGEGFMQMQVLPGEPNAHTRVEPVRCLAGTPWALYRLQPLTGRRHQLRAQMNALGLPIVGDRIYPTLWPEPAADAEPDWRNPLQLLAREIAFNDPLTGLPRRFVSRRTLALAG